MSEKILRVLVDRFGFNRVADSATFAVVGAAVGTWVVMAVATVMMFGLWGWLVLSVAVAAGRFIIIALIEEANLAPPENPTNVVDFWGGGSYSSGHGRNRNRSQPDQGQDYRHSRSGRVRDRGADPLDYDRRFG